MWYSIINKEHYLPYHQSIMHVANFLFKFIIGKVKTNEHCDKLYEKSNIGFEKTRHIFSRLLCFLLYISLKLLSLSIFVRLRVCKIEKKYITINLFKKQLYHFVPRKKYFWWLCVLF